MFGCYRTLLALMVVFLHIGGVSTIGGYAVFGFYILSGYLMTFIMQQNYGYSRGGRARYALNRFLRIYPIYWLSCILTLLLLLLLGSRWVTGFHSSMYLPTNAAAILRNFFLFFPGREIPRLTPPSWALTVELFYYIAIGLGLSKNKTLVKVWFALSIIYTLAILLLKLGWVLRYFTISAASLPFATGALIYHYRETLKPLRDRLLGWRGTPALLFALILVNWGIGYRLGTLKHTSFYLNYLICALMVLTLWDKQKLPGISRRLDQVLGELSYPIYLIHYQAGLLVLFLLSCLGYNLGRPSLTLALLSLPVIFLFAWLLTVLTERPLERIRTRVKAKNRSPQSEAVPAQIPAETT
jgi:peptidoglycan/LPS O-acetylase OafA/YrhL